MRMIRMAMLCMSGALPSAALADLEICNQTELSQSIAIGYKSDGEWISEGWWNLSAGDCVTPIKGDLQNRYYYMRAQATGQETVHDRIAFCTSAQAFTIIGDTNCEARGYREQFFRKIDTGTTARSFTVALVPEATPKTADLPTSQPDLYRAKGTVQDCVTETPDPYCTLHAEGTKFYYYRNRGGPRWIFALLESFDPATPVEISGEITDIYDRTADIILHDVTVPSWDQFDAQLIRLQGHWYALDDPNAQFTILGAELERSYDGQFTGIEYVSVGGSCGGYTVQPPYLSLREEETGELYCYAIDRLEDWYMALIYLPGGNFLEYRKLD